ncbi:MAG TPA: XrtA/PEP-CTERM system histidine kinase PrsK, partial [Burkholderiaceae bacterium]|nr:XrtA/PEP-CTERM system histidine kinase PrsK [Burkholderiaceae bacterium]
MDLAVYGFCLAAVGYGSLALKLTLLRDARVHVRRPYLAALVASALWAVVSAVVSAVPVVPELHLVPALLDIARYGLWFSFLLTLIRASGADRRTKVLVHTAGILTVLNLALVSLAPLLSAAVYPARLALFAWLSLPIFGLVVLEQVFRNVSEDFRWHAKPLCLGLGTLLVFDIYLYSGAALFSDFDVDALVMRGFAHALAVPLLFVALGRQFEWTQRFQVSRAAAFHTATLMLVGAYLLFVSAVGYYVREFGGSWGSALQFGLLCAALVGLAILLLSRALRAKVRVFVGKNFFRYHYDYRTEWLRFTEMLTSPRSPREMGERIVRGLANMLNSPSGALWALDQAKTAIVQAAFWEMPRSLERVTLDSPMVKFLLEREWVINLEEYRSHPERYEGLELPSWLVDNLRAWVIVPLIVANELTGFVVLGKPPASLHLNWEERDLLKTAGRQAAG